MGTCLESFWKSFYKQYENNANAAIVFMLSTNDAEHSFPDNFLM